MKYLKGLSKKGKENLMNKNDYVCPDCKIPIEINGKAILCQRCRQKWKIEKGIPNFSNYDFYWNQIPQEDMKKVITNALSCGWKNAVTKYFGNLQKYTQDYIIDEDRADWHFYVPLSPDAIILDIGAGWGAVSIPLARNYRKVFAVDNTLETLRFIQIRAQQEKVKNVFPVKLNPLDFPKFPFPRLNFDLVVLNGVLEWIGNVCLDKRPLQVQKQALREIFDILKLGGYIYIGIENRYSLQHFFGKKPHGELPFASILPRGIANFLTKLIKNEEHRTYIHSFKGYYRLLKNSGYDNISFFWTLPDYRFPKTIIPLNQKAVIRYWKKKILTAKTNPRKAIKLFLYNTLPGSIIYQNLGIIAQRPK